jgi:hypothetical protein
VGPVFGDLVGCIVLGNMSGRVTMIDGGGVVTIVNSIEGITVKNGFVVGAMVGVCENGVVVGAMVGVCVARRVGLSVNDGREGTMEGAKEEDFADRDGACVFDDVGPYKFPEFPCVFAIRFSFDL